MDYPKLVIRVPRGETVHTQVTLDGRPIPATRVAFDSGEVALQGFVRVRLEFIADIEFEAELPLTLTDIEAP